MVARKRRSTKRSGASSRGRRKPTVIYLVDECLGRHFVAEALKIAGAQVELHHEHFLPGAQDAEWLPVAGARKWIVLTKDRQIILRQLEITAIINARVRAFVLTAADLMGREQAEVFVRALKKMNRIAAASRGPLIGRSLPRSLSCTARASRPAGEGAHRTRQW